MKELSIIPCGKKKIWDLDETIGPVQAKEAYVGTLHKWSRRYAALFTDQWVVLSAKHGFLEADDIVDGQYDVTFNQKGQEGISIEQLRWQIQQKQLDQVDRLVVLTGKKYKPIVEACFPESLEKIYPLLQYNGIGYMLQALKNSVKTNKSIH